MNFWQHSFFRQFVFKMFINSKWFSFLKDFAFIQPPKHDQKANLRSISYQSIIQIKNKEVELQVLDENDFFMFSIDFSKKGNADFTKKNLSKNQYKKIVKLLKKSNVQKNVPPPKLLLPSRYSRKNFFGPPSSRNENHKTK